MDVTMDPTRPGTPMKISGPTASKGMFTSGSFTASATAVDGPQTTASLPRMACGPRGGGPGQDSTEARPRPGGRYRTQIVMVEIRRRARDVQKPQPYNQSGVLRPALQGHAPMLLKGPPPRSDTRAWPWAQGTAGFASFKTTIPGTRKRIPALIKDAAFARFGRCRDKTGRKDSSLRRRRPASAH